MKNFDIARQRLYNQHLSDLSFTKPEDVMNWLGAGLCRGKVVPKQ